MIPVVRNGEQINIDSELLMVGDIIIINQGIEVPCDVIVIQSTEIISDESSVTGESDPMHKDAITLENLYQPSISPFLIGKTLISSGAGRGIVLAVGTNS